MPITKIDFAPGISREATAYAETGRWYDGDKIRFRAGRPEKIGGWVKVSNRNYKGIARSLHNWTLLDGSDCLAIGTHKKIYIEQSGIFHDITPIRLVDTNTDPITSGGAGEFIHTYQTSIPHEAIVGDYVTIFGSADVDGICEDTYTDPFRTTGTGSGLVEVDTTTPHFAESGQTVTFSGVTGFDGIPAGDFNTSHQILEVTSPTTYLINLATGATVGGQFGGGTCTAEYLSRINREFEVVAVPTSDTFTFRTDTPCDAGGVNGGGVDVVTEFQISIGFSINIKGGGWNAGTWSRKGWSEPVDSTVSGIALRIWSIDNFGEDLVFCPRDGFLYYWDATNGFNTRGVRVDSLPNAIDVPVQNSIVLVTDDRHVLSIGATDQFTTIFDPMLVRWCNQEDVVNWQPQITNTAGDKRIPLGSYVMAAVATRQETLVWTERSLHSIQFVGPPFTFGLQTVAENTSIAGPNAAVNVDSITYWMGANQFWMYSGRMERMECEVQRYVFDDFNQSQAAQAYAYANDRFSEVTWLYCSAEAEQIDRYVTYNYKENVWYYGTLDRSAMVQCAGRGGLPYGCRGGLDDDGELYIHEIGYDDGTTNPPSPIRAFVESADFLVEDGDRIIFADRIIPDLTFTRSTVDDPSVTLTIQAKKFPGQPIQVADQRNVAKTVTATVDEYTKEVWARLRGRQMRLRVESTDVGVSWLLGALRVNIRLDGRQ